MNDTASRRASRPRVFFPVFALAGVAALAYVLQQPPVYVARARVQVELPPEKQGEAQSVLAQSAQTLTGNAMLESVWTRLGGSGSVGASALRGMLSAEPVAGAGAIELRAEGADREALPRILTAWIAAWRESDGGADEKSAAAALEEARGEAERLAREVETRRGEIEQFRARTGINAEGVAAEQPDAARLQELDDAMSKAVGREADTETRLKTLKESAAAGKAPPGTETSAVLEKQVSAVRLGIRNLEQDYTPLYLAHDPRYNSLRSELARLEEQIEQDKQASARQALQKAEEESAGARQAASRAREELAAAKQAAEEHAARIAEHAALTGDLARLEESQAAARDRLAHLDKDRETRAAAPRLVVLSQPAVPDRPDRPEYWRDGLLAVAGAAALGGIAAWVAGLRRRPVTPADPRPERPAGTPGAAAGPSIDGKFSRELSDSEIHALWRAAGPDGQIVIAGFLSGLSLEELAALRYEHADFVACYVRVPGISGRSCTLRDPLRRLLIERRAAQGGTAPLADAQGAPLAAAGIEGLIARAAHEAGLSSPAEITSETLRHAYFAYLVRQGARFAEIGEFIGRLSPAAHGEYTRLAPPGAGRPMEEIDPVFPALREPR